MKKKIPHLAEAKLHEMAKAGWVQNDQILNLEGEASEIREHLDLLDQKEMANAAAGKALLSELETLIQQLELSHVSNDGRSAIIRALEEYETAHDSADPASRYDIQKTKEVFTHNCWEDYYDNLSQYADTIGLDRTEDLFLTSLSERQYKDLSQSIDGEFSRKTSIRNKTDLKFLAIAITLEVAKGLLYPIIAGKAGFGEGFDPQSRMAHNDPSIKKAHKSAADAYKEQHVSKHGTGKWVEFLYRTVPYDVTAGSGLMEELNLHGGAHRLYTLGHDPILGWLFGTANILTDTITVAPGAVVPTAGQGAAKNLLKVATMRSYRVARVPAPHITPERVGLPAIIQESFAVAQENPMNLPAAVFTEGLHLKSDVYTKMGLPVPVVETFSPDFASKLYQNNYDALCLARDVKIVGLSAVISILIDTLIGLVHGFYYDPQKDGARELYEVRTRKILLIANTIGTSSNLLFAVLTGDFKGLDIGGMLVTLSHLFLDTRFLLNVKKEFVENKLYEKIDRELQELDHIEQQLMQYGYAHRDLY